MSNSDHDGHLNHQQDIRTPMQLGRQSLGLKQDKMSTPTDEITILGATGWTAAICAEHVAKGFPTNTKWCIAGRSAAKLEALRQDLRAINPDRLEPDTYVSPQLDGEGLDPLVKNTEVLINGIGPYHRHGTPVVEACARDGTHYLDFSTETAWIAQMIRDFH